MTLSLLLALGSCRTDRNPADGTQTDPNPDTEQTAAPESGEPETQTSYILVRSADAGIAERTLVRKLGNELAGVCKQLETRADDRLDGVTGTLILVGDTARQESRVTFRNSGSYTVRRVGGNLVIQGADELALDYACAAFVAYVRENGMQFPEGYCYDGQVGAGEDKRVLVADQKNGTVSVYDLSEGFVQDTPSWSVRAAYSAIAGIKVRENPKYGTVVAVCSGTSARSTGTLELFSYPDGQRVWRTDLTAYNPHSVEVSPDGKIAVAASSEGNEVRFFDTADASGQTYAAVTFTDAHGVLYDPAQTCYWVIGGSRLAAYRAEFGADGTIAVSQVSGSSYSLQTGGAHDLQAVAGTNRLWITTGKAVYQFDPATGEFLTTYQDSAVFNRANVKGISSFPDGTVCEVIPDGKLSAWTASTVRCSYQLPFSGGTLNRTLDLPEDVHIYKIRAFVTDYRY